MEWGLQRMYWLTPESDALQMELKQAKHAVLQTAEDFDVMFFGDSTAGNNIIPSQFQQETGLRAYSVHTNSNVSPSANVYLLTEYLAHHPAPKMLVLSQTLFAWSIPQHHDILLEHFMRPDIGWLLWSNGIFSTQDFLESLTSHWIPSLAYRRHILRLRQNADIVQGLLGKGAGQFDDPARGHIPVMRDISAMDAYTGEMREVGKLLRGAPTKESLGFSEEALLMTKEFCAIAKRNGIPVAIVMPPFPSGVLTQTGTLEGLRAMETYIQNETREHGCRLTNPIKMPDNVFGDGVHLNETGASLFTHRLATFIAPMLKPGK